ncbi:hypothetical protein HMPREF9454_01973 [Megamonas funiformis YIT 11815]|uniref:Uncharacterized protein n=1 Tax=Megamonas funiformis YIT 11815 TaxID=742816 RepID=A0ABN0EH64_9FIRM|nr:hypothetical protein [Megamonas funiformis]EHR34996.1 hypothetical protein HMPREF9454_01973 [Megamonas funiformis YIT 11815]
MEGWDINLLWRDIVRPAIQESPAFRHGEYVKKETMTVEGMIKIVYELLKDKLNIVKLTFSSGVNLASEEYEPHLEVDRCPLCGIALNEDGVCPKCGYKKP